MWLLYLIAVVLGGGSLLVQMFAGGDHGDAGHGLDHGDMSHPDGPGILSTREEQIAEGAEVVIIRSFLYICRPNEILIFAGRRHTLGDGSSVGYKVVRHGWALRTPLLKRLEGS